MIIRLNFNDNTPLSEILGGRGVARFGHIRFWWRLGHRLGDAENGLKCRDEARGYRGRLCFTQYPDQQRVIWTDIGQII
jgi:hypothetical protein